MKMNLIILASSRMPKHRAMSNNLFKGVVAKKNDR